VGFLQVVALRLYLLRQGHLLHHSLHTGRGLICFELRRRENGLVWFAQALDDLDELRAANVLAASRRQLLQRRYATANADQPLQVRKLEQCHVEW